MPVPSLFLTSLLSKLLKMGRWIDSLVSSWCQLFIAELVRRITAYNEYIKTKSLTTKPIFRGSIVDIITLAMTYFDDGKVPSNKQFMDEIWRPNRQEMTPNERQLTDFMTDYVYCYEKIEKLQIDSQTFEMRYRNLLSKEKDMNPLLSRPLDVESLKELIVAAKIKKEEIAANRKADRLAVLTDVTAEVADKLSVLNDRRAVIVKLMNDLIADIDAVSDEIDDKDVRIDVSNLFNPNGGFIISDQKAPNYWLAMKYAYNIETGALVAIKEPDCDCDCCDCD